MNAAPGGSLIAPFGDACVVGPPARRDVAQRYALAMRFGLWWGGLRFFSICSVGIVQPGKGTLNHRMVSCDGRCRGGVIQQGLDQRRRLGQLAGFGQFGGLCHAKGKVIGHRVLSDGKRW
jgi:hypothetical protein